MHKTVLNVRTDRDVKEQAQQIARDLGVPLSVIVNVYLKEFVRERAITISLTPQLRPEIGKILQSASVDVAKGKNIGKKHTSVASALKYLHS